MPSAYLFLISTTLVLSWIVNNFFKFASHQSRLQRVPIRIHVNGIRGKSTVSRIVAGLLREAKIQTVGKTTGSAACFILPDGNDQKIFRRGAPTILEQIDFVRTKVSENTDAIVVECMAIRPEYQKICESKIIQSNIGILTNVREDHQDVLGESLEQIARSLMNTCPENGILITAECNQSVLSVIREIAKGKRTKVIAVSAESVSDQELKAYPYQAFKENIAIGFEVARLLKIPREVAHAGMVSAPPDPGVLRVQKKTVRCSNGTEKRVTWANLFAVNDRQSVINVVDSLLEDCPANTLKIGILNNRADREDRALQFANIVSNELEFDKVALLGAYESRVSEVLRKNGIELDHQILLGEHRGHSLREMLCELIERAGQEEIFLAAMVNIHTPQAIELLSFFEPDTEH